MYHLSLLTTNNIISPIIPSLHHPSRYEHSVANLMLLPAALLAGAPLSMRDVILKNLIPVTIGNGIAGALLVAASFSFQFGKLGEGR